MKLRYINKAIIILLSCICCTISTYAQSITDNEIVRSELDEMFENLDKSKIPTGLLLDYAMNIVDFDLFDGSELNEDNTVTLLTFENMLHSINSAAVNTAPCSDVPLMISSLKESDDGINVGFLAYKYNYIKAEALDDGLMNYSSGQVSDRYVNGIWQNPYDEAVIFGFTTGAYSEETGNITFNFTSDHILTNMTFSSFYFDAGDGEGYRSITFPNTVSTSYLESGEKELKFKAISANGEVYESHSVLVIRELDMITTATDNPDKTEEFITSNTYTGTTVGAQVSTYYRTGNNKLTRPFVVVEGFDPWQLLEAFDKFKLFKKTNGILGSTNHINFKSNNWNAYQDSQYDFIYIDWFNSTADIRDNAYLLMDILNDLEAQKYFDDCEERTILMGQSMGGLVARYALNIMEENGDNHGVGTFISHDTPHLGANVPLGALYTINHFMYFLAGNGSINNTLNILGYITSLPVSDTKRLIWETLHSPAARQMLVNYVNEGGVLDNQEHEEFVAIMDEMGFPEGDEGYPIENLAIVNGWKNDLEDMFEDKFDGEEKYASLDFYHSFLNYSLSISAEIYPYLQNSSRLSYLDITYVKKFRWKEGLSYYLFSDDSYSPSSGLCYDGLPGSVYEVDYSAEFNIFNFLFDFDIDLKLTENFMFIPTGSALCLYNRTENDFSNLYYDPNSSTDYPEPKIDTPFDAYRLAIISPEDHIYIDKDGIIYFWIDNQINMRILGPDKIETESVYTIEGYHGYVNWSVSDSTIATINNSGKLTAVGNGVVTVIAENFTNGELIRKTKDVLVGFPEMVISSSFEAGAGYVFSVEAVDPSYQDDLDLLLDSSVMEYEWSIIDLYGNMTTDVTSSNTFEFLPDEDEYVTVCVRLVDNSGNKSPLYSTTLDLQCPFLVNYEYIRVTPQGIVTWVTYNDSYQYYPTFDFGVQYLFPIYNEDDNVNSVSNYLKGGSCYLSYPDEYDENTYITGVRDGANYIWYFELWNSEMFLETLNSAIWDAENGYAEPGDIVDLNMIICNSLYEPLQRLKLAIVHVEY